MSGWGWDVPAERPGSLHGVQPLGASRARRSARGRLEGIRSDGTRRPPRPPRSTSARHASRHAYHPYAHPSSHPSSHAPAHPRGPSAGRSAGWSACRRSGATRARGWRGRRHCSSLPSDRRNPRPSGLPSPPAASALPGGHGHVAVSALPTQTGSRSHRAGRRSARPAVSSMLPAPPRPAWVARNQPAPVPRAESPHLG